jgi:FMN phosphatase YigB (HAD superfamily)
MGCDFYTYYVVRVEYKDGDKTEVKSQEIESTRERHYFWEIDDRDEDFEEYNDYYIRRGQERERQIENEISQYPRKDIYKDGKWLCVESSKEKYISICKKMEINEKDIISIWKEGDFHYR